MQHVQGSGFRKRVLLCIANASGFTARKRWQNPILLSVKFCTGVVHHWSYIVSTHKSLTPASCASYVGAGYEIRCYKETATLQQYITSCEITNYETFVETCLTSVNYSLNNNSEFNQIMSTWQFLAHFSITTQWGILTSNRDISVFYIVKRLFFFMWRALIR